MHLPLCCDPCHPPRNILEALGAHVITHLPPPSPRVHQPHAMEHGQVPGDRGTGDGKSGRERGRRRLAEGREEVQHLPARGIGDGHERIVDRTRKHRTAWAHPAPPAAGAFGRPCGVSLVVRVTIAERGSATGTDAR